MAVSTSTQRVSLEHPYKDAGIVVMVLSLILIAFDIGFFELCGGGTGVCVDFGTHRAGTTALLVFFITFVLGIVMIVYTGASTSVTSATTRVAAPPTVVAAAPPQVTVVAPAAPSPPPPATTVYVGPPRQSA